MVEHLGGVDGVFFAVAAVVVDSRDDEFLLGGGEELVGLGGEVDDDEPADEADDGRNGALDDEDP